MSFSISIKGYLTPLRKIVTVEFTVVVYKKGNILPIQLKYSIETSSALNLYRV